jgi:hypothetical protein
MTTEPNYLPEVVSGLRQRWSHPRLFALTMTTDEVAPVLVAEALLEDLAAPTADIAQGFHQLLDVGEFQACRELLDSEAETLSNAQRRTLGQRLVNAIAVARNGLLLKEHQLATSAMELGIPGPAEEWDRLLEVRKADAVRALEGFAAVLRKARDERRAAIEQLLPGLDQARRKTVLACLETGMYTAAEQIATQASEPEPWHGPTAVADVGLWDYAQSPNDEVLRWFVDVAAAPADFEQHRPAADDEAGKRLVRAMHEAFEHLDADTAERLGDALDGLIMDTSIRHPARPAAAGFDIDLRGAADPRLPWLALPRKLIVHIGPQPPIGSGLRLWLPTIGNGYEAPDGVQLLDPRFLFLLVEPDAASKPRTAEWRRISLLRRICIQLPFDQVVDPDEDLGDSAEARASLRWMFDLLGLRAAAEVPDMVLYETAALRVVLYALVRSIADTVLRPGKLTLDHLEQLRESEPVKKSLFDAVFGLLSDDLAAQVVYGALLGKAAKLGSERVRREQLEEELDDLTMAVMQEHEDQTGRLHDFPVARLNVGAALQRIDAVGLAAVDQDVVLPGQGLVTLLGGILLAQRTVEALKRFHANRDEVEERARLALQSRTQRQNKHARAGYQYALTQLTEKLKSDGLTKSDRARLVQRIEAQNKLIAEHTAIENGDVDALLQLTVFDIIVLIEEVATDQREANNLTIDIVNDAGMQTEVMAMRLLVKLALVDLTHNAVQAMESVEAPQRRMRIVVRYEDSLPGRFAVLDVEDSGPGFGKVDVRLLDNRRREMGMRGGEGLRHAALNLEACNGKLERIETRSSLGGAHLRVWLPLAE